MPLRLNVRSTYPSISVCSCQRQLNECKTDLKTAVKEHNRAEIGLNQAEEANKRARASQELSKREERLKTLNEEVQRDAGELEEVGRTYERQHFSVGSFWGAPKVGTLT